MTQRARLITFAVALVAAIGALHIVGRSLSAGSTSLFDNPAEGAVHALRWLALGCSYYLLAIVAAMLVFGDRVESSGLARFIPFGVLASLGLTAATSVLGAVPTAGETATVAPLVAPLSLTPQPEPLQLGDAQLSLGNASEGDRVKGLDIGSELRLIGEAAESNGHDRVWPVVAGDNFWSIAEELVGENLGRTELDDSEIAGYWHSLINANKDRLVDPENPDLLLPGQQLVLPELPSDDG